MKTPEKILIDKGFFVMSHKEGSEAVRKAFIEPVIKAIKAYHDQFELSDKEIKKELESYLQKLAIPMDDYQMFRIEVAFEYAAKWYREQLKKMIK